MKLAELMVQAGEHERIQCPADTAVSIGHDLLGENLVLWDESDGKAVPVQVRRNGNGSVHLAWIVDRMDRHESRTYELRVLDHPCRLVDGVDLKEKPGKLVVSIGGHPFTTYNHDQVVRPYLYPNTRE